MPVKPSKVQDLDIDTIVTTERHDKDVGDLSVRLGRLEAKFGTHEQIADTLSITARKAAKLQELITTAFIKSICTDDKVKDAVTVLINKADRHWFYSNIKRIGKMGGGMLLIILGAVAKTLSDKYLH